MLKPLFALDQPQYHRVTFGETHRVRGAVLALEGPEIHTLTVHRGAIQVAETAVELSCPELAFLQIPHAAHSRFEFDLRIDEGAPLELRAHGKPLFRFDTELALRERDRMRRLTEYVEALPLPDGELVATTQGGRDVRSYQDSIVSGFFTIEALLRRAGIQPSRVDSILDVGCGTGRLLAGWRMESASRRLVGVDINASLISWTNSHFAHIGEWHTIEGLPPLTFDDASFDLAILASVFTHLPLAWQRAWVTELARLVSPGGTVILTLHGAPYARVLLDDAGRDLVRRNGYAERPAGAPGENAFGTFHSPAFARTLLHPFEIVARFPMGAPEDDVASWFPIAAWQDIYVLRR